MYYTEPEFFSRNKDFSEQYRQHLINNYALSQIFLKKTWV